MNAPSNMTIDHPLKIVVPPLKVNWEGSLFVHHSLGMVNREILRELVADPRFDVRHVPFEPDRFSPGSNSKFGILQSIIGAPHADAVAHVRHRWPPDFTPPSSGAYVLFQPWEYGCLPVEWVETIPGCVGEVWVYTSYLKECYAASGLDEDMIHIIPLGIDPGEFRPGAPPAPWVREKIDGRYCFLYNGGITLRKGVDILINAYLSEFRANEPACLLIKGSNAYTKELAAKVEALSQQTDIASIIYLTQDIPPTDLPGLYTACDCYVHPYRAEGYGLPVAEAMACGMPVIVTGAGACRDFTGEETAFLIKCSMEKLNTWSVGGMRTVGNPFWLKPDLDDLRNLMRYAYRNRDEARSRGLRASESIRLNHTWKHAANAVADRLLALA
jgi:glycosyltransferase involved in cell wall biosynthesis